MIALLSTWAVVGGQQPGLDYGENANPIIVLGICSTKQTAEEEASTLRSKVFTDLGKHGAINSTYEDAMLDYRRTIRAVCLTMHFNEGDA